MEAYLELKIIKLGFWSEFKMKGKTSSVSFLAVILGILFLNSCGGGGGGSSNTIDDDPIPTSNIIAPSTLPSYNGTYFEYTNGNQRFSVQSLSSTDAIGVATFKNNSSASGEGDIKVKSITGNAAKQSSSNNQKILPPMDTDSRFQISTRNNIKWPLKYSQKMNNTSSHQSKLKSNRADDAIGTRDSFYHDEGGTKGFKDFEKIYSGTFCLIYSEVDASTDLPFVNSTRGKIIGDTFEISNPYHPTGKSIFEVVTSLFGNPWGIDINGELINGGGRDGEKQVIFLIYNGGSSSGTYGYFFWVDEEPKGFINPDPSSKYVSNGAEIVYLNKRFANDDIAILSTIAHEYQHLCDYNQKFILNGDFTGQIFDESFDAEGPTMFNEGQSVLSEELNGFALEMAGGKGNDFIFTSVNTYIKTISTLSPNFFSWNGQGDYGKGYLFWRYFYDTYGEDKVKIATHSELLQPANIEFATGKKMDVILQEFILALMQTEKTQEVLPTINISTITPLKTYFDSKGKSLGKFSEIDYISGFEDNLIKSEAPYEIRLYKLLPVNNEVSFTLENIKPLSNFAIFTSVIDK